jgi:hypothetical protein
MTERFASSESNDGRTCTKNAWPRRRRWEMVDAVHDEKREHSLGWGTSFQYARIALLLFSKCCRAPRDAHYSPRSGHSHHAQVHSLVRSTMAYIGIRWWMGISIASPAACLRNSRQRSTPTCETFSSTRSLPMHACTHQQPSLAPHRPISVVRWTSRREDVTLRHRDQLLTIQDEQ